MVALSDDSGLEIKSLGNKPGIHSARWAKKYGGFNNAMKKILLFTFLILVFAVSKSNSIENKIKHIIVSYNDVESVSQVFAHELYHSFGYNHKGFRRFPLDDIQMAIIKKRFHAGFT